MFWILFLAGIGLSIALVISGEDEAKFLAALISGLCMLALYRHLDIPAIAMPSIAQILIVLGSVAAILFFTRFPQTLKFVLMSLVVACEVLYTLFIVIGLFMLAAHFIAKSRKE